VAFPKAQQAIVAFLSKKVGAEPIETHISGVFVGTENAWKLKKAVHLPYLDFSAQQSRRKFLHRELQLNQPDAPEIYRDIFGIEPAEGGSFVLRPEAECHEAVDWVLRMAPLSKDAFLDEVARRGNLTPTLQDALADCVAQSHATRPAHSGWNSAGALRGSADQSEKDAIAAGLAAEQCQHWRQMFESALLQNAAWLQTRAESGFVRRCHGDLHLGNLCLWHGRPTLFDALEFDEALATIDVGYDIGFLLMDLDQKVSRAAANRVMNRYLARTGDTALSRGLPMFLSLRAMIRAHISATTGLWPAASRYLGAALQYLAPLPARVVAIGGLQGSGKSTVSRSVAPLLGRVPGGVIIRSDEIRKRLFGVAPEQGLPASAYDSASNEAVLDKMAAYICEVARGGQSVIADATFLDAAHRCRIEQAARQAGVPFRGFWLVAPIDVLEERITHRVGDASDANLAVLRAAQAKDQGANTWRHVDAADLVAASAIVQQVITMTG
jgi:aminoglycoside phosphotransferase family enzyme/predicted kinase